MGTLVFLYQHPEAPRIVKELNERNRRWNESDPQAYWDMGKTLDIQKDTGLPRDVQKVDFQSKKYPDFYPTGWKVHHLEGFLESYGLMPLHAIFGYASWEPEDWYSIPDWEKSLESIQWVVQSFPSVTKEKSEDVSTYRRHLEAFEEMIFWIINQKDHGSYFLLWSA